MLRNRSGMNNDREDINEFVRKCRPYLDMRGEEIPKEDAQQLLNEFLELYKE